MIQTIQARIGRPLSGRAVRGVSVVVIGSLAWQLLRLLSTMALARLLGPEQFGLASMFLLVTTAAEMTANVGLDKQIVQSDEGDNPEFLATCHAVSAIRGVLLALIILLLAPFIAGVMGIPEYAWAFMLLALSPVCMGFSNLGRKHVQRKMSFGPDMTVDLVAQCVSFLVAIAIAWHTRHFTAALWALLINSLVALIASHCIAGLRYRWAWRPALVRDMVTFGWPLLLSNILLFATMHGERVLLASAPKFFPEGPYTLEDLGLFAAAGTLAYAPVVVLSRIGSTVTLPWLTSAKSELIVFRRRLGRALLLVSGFSVIMVGLFWICGENALELLYGAEYRQVYMTLMVLGFSQSLRVIRVVPTNAALALGDSHCSMYSNIVRAFGIGLSAWVLSCGLSLSWMAAAGALGELLALLASMIVCVRTLNAKAHRGPLGIGASCLTER